MTSKRISAESEAAAEVSMLEFAQALFDRMVLAAGRKVVAADDLFTELRKAAPAAAEQMIALAGHEIEGFSLTMREATASGGQVSMIAQGEAGQRVAALLSSVMAADADPHTLTLAKKTAAAVDDAVAEQEAALAMLEQAVSVGDLDEVMRLRPQVEVALPVAVGRARVAALDAELEVLDASSIAAGQRLAAAAHQLVDAAQERVAQAQAALNEASERERALTVLAMHVRTAFDQCGQERQALIRRRDELIASVQADSTHRLRRLAGLDTAPAAGQQSESSPDPQAAVAYGQRKIERRAPMGVIVAQRAGSYEPYAAAPMAVVTTPVSDLERDLNRTSRPDPGDPSRDTVAATGTHRATWGTV